MRYLNLFLVLVVSLTAGDALCAANRPHADRALQANRTWTNDDLEGLSRIPGLISIVGPLTNQDVQEIDTPPPQRITEDPAWYAAQAALLNTRLETQQANLRHFKQVLDDARVLKSTTSGINVTEDDIGITPEAAIDILQNRVRETQGELDDLENLARHNSIPPGILRVQ